jgi:hypothetical protein
VAKNCENQAATESLMADGAWSQGVRHRAVEMPCPYDSRPIPIDVKLAPLMRLIWDTGIKTNQCCQEDRRGHACIEFNST